VNKKKVTEGCAATQVQTKRRKVQVCGAMNNYNSIVRKNYARTVEKGGEKE